MVVAGMGEGPPCRWAHLEGGGHGAGHCPGPIGWEQVTAPGEPLWSVVGTPGPFVNIGAVLVDKRGTWSSFRGPVGDTPGDGETMNFAFSEEQDELRKSVRRFLDDKSPETEVRRLMETTEGDDPAVWSLKADEVRLEAHTIPEQYVGSGFAYVELIVVLEEMGASLLCAPFFSTVALATN